MAEIEDAHETGDDGETGHDEDHDGRERGEGTDVADPRQDRRHAQAADGKAGIVDGSHDADR